MRKLLAILAMAALLPLAQCSNDKTTAPPPPGDRTEGDQIATEWFIRLGDSLEAMSRMEWEEIRNVDFSEIRQGFNEALSKDADNPIAHLGLSILDLVELNYSEDVWEVIDAFDAWLHGGAAARAGQGSARHRTLIGRQFSLMVEAPMAVHTRLATAFPPDLELHNIQRIIEEIILPKLRSAMGHLAVTESHTDVSLRIRIDDGTIAEYVVIDLGEIFVFDAALHALAAAFEMAVAYDVDLYGPDGTYGWVDRLREFSEEDYWCASACVVTPASPYPSLDEYYVRNKNNAYAESLMVRVLHHNLVNRSAFLGLRRGGAVMGQARQDMLGTVAKLEAAANFIRNVRQGETEENVIKLTDLTDIDAQLGGPNVPNFAKNFRRVEDVLGFVRSLLTEVVPFSEELGPDRITFTWTMDLGRLFTSPIANVQALLPYHTWNLPAGAWISIDEYVNYAYDNFGGVYYAYEWNGEYCEMVFFSSIGLVTGHVRHYSLDWGGQEPLLLLDGPGGNPIDLEIERFPYFPDYTFNGLLPDMGSRQRWLALIDILDRDPVPPGSPPTMSRR